MNTHQIEGMNWKHARTLLKEREAIARKHGVRFTELLRLPYFNTIRFAIVHPMHTILLGSSKHLMSLWREFDIIEKSKLPLIQETVDKFMILVEYHNIIRCLLALPPLQLTSGKIG